MVEWHSNFLCIFFASYPTKFSHNYMQNLHFFLSKIYSILIVSAFVSEAQLMVSYVCYFVYHILTLVFTYLPRHMTLHLIHLTFWLYLILYNAATWYTVIKSFCYPENGGYSCSTLFLCSIQLVSQRFFACCLVFYLSLQYFHVMLVQIKIHYHYISIIYLEI